MAEPLAPAPEATAEVVAPSVAQVAEPSSSTTTLDTSWMPASLIAAGAELAERHNLRKRATDLASSLQEAANVAASKASTKMQEAMWMIGATPQPHSTPPPPLEISEWAALLDACEAYATMRGWRFDLQDLMDLEAATGHEARARAVPVALLYADRIHDSHDTDSALLLEFRLCQQLVASDAVYNTAVTTCRALGLWDETQIRGAARSAESESESPSEHTPLTAEEVPLPQPLPQALLFAVDFSRPLPEIARRLQAIEQQLRETGGDVERYERLYRASFIVEFGLAHELPPWHDSPSDWMLRQFLERAKEWRGRDEESTALVQALVLEELDARPSLRQSALDWFSSHADWIENNKVKVATGGAVFGFVGLVAAGAVIAAAGRSGRGR